MSFIRARQPLLTRLFPHPGNRRFLVPNRKTTQQSIPVMGVVPPQTDTQLIPITPLDVSAFLVSGAGITWSASGLPTGLTIAAATGIISGTAPAAAAFAAANVTATNAFGADTSANFLWTISI